MIEPPVFVAIRRISTGLLVVMVLIPAFGLPRGARRKNGGLVSILLYFALCLPIVPIAVIAALEWERLAEMRAGWWFEGDASAEILMLLVAPFVCVFATTVSLFALRAAALRSAAIPSLAMALLLGCFETWFLSRMNFH